MTPSEVRAGGWSRHLGEIQDAPIDVVVPGGSCAREVQVCHSLGGNQRRSELTAREIRAASVRDTAKVLRSVPRSVMALPCDVDVTHRWRLAGRSTAGGAIRDKEQPATAERRRAELLVSAVDGRAEIQHRPPGRALVRSLRHPEVVLPIPARPRRGDVQLLAVRRFDGAAVVSGRVRRGHRRGRAPVAVVARSVGGAGRPMRRRSPR